MYISNTDVNSVDAAAFLAAMRYQTIRVNRIGYSQTFRFQTTAVAHYSGYAALSVTFLDMVGTPLTPVHGADYSIALTGNPGPTGPTGPEIGWPALAPTGPTAPQYSLTGDPEVGMLLEDGEAALRSYRLTGEGEDYISVRAMEVRAAPDDVVVRSRTLATPWQDVVRIKHYSSHDVDAYDRLEVFDGVGLNPRKVWNAGNFPVEMGSWTPTLGGSVSDPTVTYAAQAAQWIRLGPNLVWVMVRVATSSRVGGEGNVEIRGFPFQMVNVNNGTAGVLAIETSQTQFPLGYPSMRARSVGNVFSPIVNRDDLGHFFMPIDNWKANGNMAFSGLVLISD